MADTTNDIWNDNDGEEERGPRKGGRLRRFLIFFPGAGGGAGRWCSWRPGGTAPALTPCGGCFPTAAARRHRRGPVRLRRLRQQPLCRPGGLPGGALRHKAAGPGRRRRGDLVHIRADERPGPGDGRRPGRGLRRGRHGAVCGGRGGARWLTSPHRRRTPSSPPGSTKTASWR